VRFGSVCSGIEAAGGAWEALGWRPSFVSEIEEFPRAVLRHRFPHAPLHGDFTTLQRGDYDPIRLLVGGTPCQSFSVAGRRAGLDDDRGKLALEYILLADRLRPAWVVWENVPGVFSIDDGEAFRCFLAGLVRWDVRTPNGGWRNAGVCAPAPVDGAYGVAWRVLDAQFVRVDDDYAWAVPQRRRRVLVVGYLGDWRPAVAVLFERDSLCGHPPPRREARKGHPRAAALGFGGGRQSGPSDAATALTAHGRRLDWEAETFVAEPVAAVSTGNGWRDEADGAAACLRAQDSITKADTLIAEPVAFSCKDYGADATTGASPTLRAMGHGKTGANGGGQVAIAFQGRGSNLDVNGEVAGTIGTNCDRASGGAPMVAEPIPFDTTQITSAANYSRPSAGDPSHPLAAGAHAPAIAFHIRGRDGGAMPEIEPGAVHQDERTTWRVRRLTPVECERLQGFPDDFTLIPWKGGMATDGHRYKALGNSMAVNVMRWIGRRIEAVEAILPEMAL
jgi:DNA (cytosine-5)-methyltransferase 1